MCVGGGGSDWSLFCNKYILSFQVLAIISLWKRGPVVLLQLYFAILSLFLAVLWVDMCSEIVALSGHTAFSNC